MSGATLGLDAGLEELLLAMQENVANQVHFGTHLGLCLLAAPEAADTVHAQ